MLNVMTIYTYILLGLKIDDIGLAAKFSLQSTLVCEATLITRVHHNPIVTVPSIPTQNNPKQIKRRKAHPSVGPPP